jgi:hypothetical protein
MRFTHSVRFSKRLLAILPLALAAAHDTWLLPNRTSVPAGAASGGRPGERPPRWAQRTGGR